MSNNNKNRFKGPEQQKIKANNQKNTKQEHINILNDSKDDIISDFEKTLLETQNFKKKRSEKKLEEAKKMSGVYRNIQNSMSLYDQIQQEKDLKGHKNMRDAYAQQIRIKSGQNSLKQNLNLFEAKPARNLLDDLQTDNFRFKQELETYDKKRQKQSHESNNNRNEKILSQDKNFNQSQFLSQSNIALEKIQKNRKMLLSNNSSLYII